MLVCFNKLGDWGLCYKSLSLGEGVDLIRGANKSFLEEVPFELRPDG